MPTTTTTPATAAMTLHAALPSASWCASAAGDGAGESNVVVAVARGDGDAAPPEDDAAVDGAAVLAVPPFSVNVYDPLMGWPSLETTRHVTVYAPSPWPANGALTVLPSTFGVAFDVDPSGALTEIWLPTVSGFSANVSSSDDGALVTVTPFFGVVPVSSSWADAAGANAIVVASARAA